MPREPPRQVLVRVGALLGGALQSAIHNTEGGYEVLVRARGRGRGVALRRSEPPVRPGRRALGLSEELLQPVVAKLPREVPQPEHVVEKIVHRGPSRRVVSGYGAELRIRVLGHQSGAEHLRPSGACGAPRSHPQGLVSRWEVAGCLVYRLAVVWPEEL